VNLYEFVTLARLRNCLPIQAKNLIDDTVSVSGMKKARRT